MTKIKQLLTLIITKVTFGKDGLIHYTIHHPQAENYPTLVFKKENILKDKDIKEVFDQLTQYGK